MKRYRVQITEKAFIDMEEIYNYIADDLLEPEYAMNQYNRIADSIEGLALFPERIKIMQSDKEAAMELRRLLVDNYSVFYVIQNDNVIVTRVLYSASDIEECLADE
ncbi:MAG: type II toxin-antitoxin system RelE/ParE family toxin [Faecalimonas sp.]|nr:type II toxin-antitoxin system RelE/ParE family toxin [Faecalimonas sp.]